MSDTPNKRPWWSYGHVWMLISGPAVVVVAGFFTYYLAVRQPDPVLPTTGSADSTGQSAELGAAPAMQARNHAAAGKLPVKETK
jgi:hypothetical protein